MAHALKAFEKITWGGQVREKPLHLTPYDYFEQEQAKQKVNWGHILIINN
jgi:hypothetical protein